MKAGRLSTRITIEQVSETREASGSVTRTWATFATVWAEIVPLRGREFYAAQAVQAEGDVRIRIRRLAGVTEKMRVDVGGVLHDIRAVINDPNQRGETWLVCKSGLNKG